MDTLDLFPSSVRKPKIEGLDLYILYIYISVSGLSWNFQPDKSPQNRTVRFKTRHQATLYTCSSDSGWLVLLTVADLCCCCRHCRWLCITSFPVAYKQRVVLSWCIPGWGVWGAEENPILWVTWFCVTVMDHCLASDHVGCCSNISVLVCQWYFSAESESLVYHVLLN